MTHHIAMSLIAIDHGWAAAGGADTYSRLKPDLTLERLPSAIPGTQTEDPIDTRRILVTLGAPP